MFWYIAFLLIVRCGAADAADITVMTLAEWRSTKAPGVVVDVELDPGSSSAVIHLYNGFPGKLLLNNELNVAYLVDDSGRSVDAVGGMPLHSKNALDYRRSFLELFPDHIEVGLDSVSRNIRLPKVTAGLMIAVNIAGYRGDDMEYFDRVYFVPVPTP